MTVLVKVLRLAVDSKPTLSAPDERASEVCVPNISKSEQRKRLVFGMVSFIFAVSIFVALLFTGTDRLWRLPLFLFFAGAASGYFQAREKT